jgi:hypothetical protein
MLHESAVGRAYEFVRRFWLSIAAISTVLLIPCFWHAHLEAGDLASHTYNAWLAQLIAKGQAPGLFLAHQWNNVLFDFLMSGLATLFGLAIGEKIAASVAVLVFFWGAFAVASEISNVPDCNTTAWFLVPCFAVLAYGYTFEMGFINYYLSIGLAFWGMTVLARSDIRPTGSLVLDAITVLLLAAMMWLAHPLGLCVFASASAYIILARHLVPKRHIYLFSAAVLILIVVHTDIKVRHRDVPYSSDFFGLLASGADQLWVYEPHGQVTVYLATVLFVASLLFDSAQRWRTPQWRQSYLLPTQLYVLTLLAVSLIPSGLKVPHHLGMGVLGFIKERLTIVAAVFACCLLAQTKRRKWHYVGFAALAATFFSCLYVDTGRISRMEDEVEQLVASLPIGRRVISYMLVPPNNRATIECIPDRACVGRCFSYNNYEVPSGQFRVRAESSNPIVLTGDDGDAARRGDYVVQQRDLPVSLIYQCVPNTMAACLGELRAGQEVRSGGAPH